MLHPGHFIERKLRQSILQSHEIHHPSHFIELPRTKFTLRTPFKGNLLPSKVTSPGKTPEKTESMLDWPLYTPPPTENASIKWPVQAKPLKKQNLCWTGHFIPLPPTENASIKWPVQVKPLKKHIFTWNGHVIPQPVGSNDPSWQPSFPDGQPCSATRPCSLLQHPSWTKRCPPTAMLMATHHPSANSSRKPRHQPPETAAYLHPNCGLWIEHIWRLASIKTVSRPKSTVRGTHWTSRRKSVCGKKNHRYYNDRCLVGNPHYSATVRHKYYYLDVRHFTL